MPESCSHTGADALPIKRRVEPADALNAITIVDHILDIHKAPEEHPRFGGGIEVCHTVEDGSGSDTVQGGVNARARARGRLCREWR